MQIIFHLDIDSYFVSAHRSVDKSLNNKCIVVSNGGNRSIITSASYEAKNKGIKVPMPLYKAKMLIPNLLIIKPNYALYNELSTKFFNFITKKYSQKIEITSIDECYINVTKIVKTTKKAIELAKKIQKEIFYELDLPCSIGISNNKFVTKMSTQINKPFGISLINQNKFLEIFGYWKISKFHGIGKAISKKLNNINIFTIQDLANSNENNLKHIFGINTQNFINKANGIDISEINTKMNELKTISKSITFQVYDKSSKKEILKTLSHLTENVMLKAYNHNMIGSVVKVSIKNTGPKEIKMISKQKTLNRSIYSYEDIFKIATYLFEQLWFGQKIKFICISLNKLRNKYINTYQSSIFDNHKKDNKINKIIKNINDKFKNEVVYLGIKKIRNKQNKYLELNYISKKYKNKYKK